VIELALDRSMANEDDTPDVEEADDASVPSRGLVIHDIFGIGAAAKSPVAREIAKAAAKAFGAIADPARTLLMGLAKNKVEANRIKSVARAEAEARLLSVETDNLVERMKQRVVATEVRRQLNIETAITEAVELAESEDPNNQSRPIDDDWMAMWVEGVQGASVSTVRTMWARVLKSQAVSSEQSVSGPSLGLLRNLDAELARAFTEFTRFIVAYQRYPHHGKVRPSIISPRNLKLLEELGFIRHISERAFPLRAFALQLKANIITMNHGSYVLTVRAHELAEAIFGRTPFEAGLRGRLPSHDDQIKIYLELIEALIEEGPSPVSLLIRGNDANHDAVLDLKTSAERQPDSKFEEWTAQLSDKSVTPDDVQTGVLRGLYDRGLAVQIRTIPKLPAD
jgi:hypothetical protein